MVPLATARLHQLGGLVDSQEVGLVLGCGQPFDVRHERDEPARHGSDGEMTTMDVRHGNHVRSLRGTAGQGCHSRIDVVFEAACGVRSGLPQLTPCR
jgi:hypothetical protein